MGLIMQELKYFLSSSQEHMALMKSRQAGARDREGKSECVLFGAECEISVHIYIHLPMSI